MPIAPPLPSQAAAALRRAIKTWTPETLQCRINGHSWINQETWFYRNTRTYQTEERCLCGSMRYRALATDGTVTHTRYRYSPDYRRTLGHRLTKLQRGEIRLHQLMQHRMTTIPSKER